MLSRLQSSLTHQLQEDFWAGEQARDEPVRALERLVLPGTEGPSDIAAVADLVIRHDDGYPPLSWELALDLAVERLLVGFNRQQEGGPLLPELSKNGCWVWERIRIDQHTAQIQFPEKLLEQSAHRSRPLQSRPERLPRPMVRSRA